MTRLLAIAAALLAAAAVGVATYAALDERRHEDGRPPGDRRRAASRRRRRLRSPSPSVYNSASKGVVEITATHLAHRAISAVARAQQAQGSGFVYDTAGHVITNQHVVEGAQSLSVKLWNGATYKATLVGTRSVDRPRGAEDRRAVVGPPSAHARRLERRRGRSDRGRDREPLRPRRDRHRRHRQRAPPRDDRAEQLHDHRLDPDRRRDQPRQLGRAAARPERQGDRRQRADRERLRRKRRRRIRDPFEHRQVDRLAADLERQRPATPISASESQTARAASG